MAAVPPIVSATPPADVELSADANRSYVDQKSKFYVVTPGMHDRIKRLHVRLLVEGEELVVGGPSALEVVPEVGGVELGCRGCDIECQVRTWLSRKSAPTGAPLQEHDEAWGEESLAV